MTPMTRKTWLPTRKWATAQLTALGGLAIMLLTGDRAVTDPEVVAIVTFLVQAGASYFMPNESTPGGVPRRPA